MMWHNHDNLAEILMMFKTYSWDQEKEIHEFEGTVTIRPKNFQY